MKATEKDRRFEIVGVIFSYEVSKGHLKWKVAEVSRKLGISRNLVYYHFGNSKKAILDSCYRIVAEEFYGLNHDFSKIFDFQNRDLEKSVLATRKIYLRTPAIVTFFHRWRLENSPGQKRIVEMERKYQEKLHKVLPHKSHDEILAIHTVIHGIVTSPFATPAAVAMVVDLLKPLLETKRVSTAAENRER